MDREKERWVEPKILTYSEEQLEEFRPKTLTIESSLYASGCHHGRFS
jgi:hypothetical protein